MKHWIGGLVLIAALAAGTQGWTAERLQITLVSGYGKGSPTDLATELAAIGFRKSGASVTIDHVTGDAGRLAAERVASAGPGATVLLVSEILNQALAEHAGRFKGGRLVPVAKLTTGLSTALFVRGDSPIRNWQDFVSAAKARSLSGATTNRLSVLSMPFGMLEKHIGVRFVDVEADGAGGAIELVASQKTDFSIATTAAVATSQGKLRPILTFGAERSPAFPDVPTFAEVTGNRKLAFTLSFAVFAPSGTLPTTLRQRENALLKLAADGDAAKLARQNQFPLSPSPALVARQALERDRRVARMMLNQ